MLNLRSNIKRLFAQSRSQTRRATFRTLHPPLALYQKQFQTSSFYGKKTDVSKQNNFSTFPTTETGRRAFCSGRSRRFFVESQQGASHRFPARMQRALDASSQKRRGSFVRRQNRAKSKRRLNFRRNARIPESVFSSSRHKIVGASFGVIAPTRLRLLVDRCAPIG